MKKQNESNNTVMDNGYIFLNQTPSQFFERRAATLYGINSAPIRALDLVRQEMCVEKGFKRDDGQDYYNHCVDVANTLISFCVKDEDAVCAALLHDIVEDVDGYTEQTIARLFNRRVANLVMLVTKEPGRDYKNPNVIGEYLQNISEDMYAATIKTADRMHNMMTLQEKTFEARYRKAIENDQYSFIYTPCALDLRNGNRSVPYTVVPSQTRPVLNGQSIEKYVLNVPESKIKDKVLNSWNNNIVQLFELLFYPIPVESNSEDAKTILLKKLDYIQLNVLNLGKRPSNNSINSEEQSKTSNIYKLNKIIDER